MIPIFRKFIEVFIFASLLFIGTAAIPSPPLAGEGKGSQTINCNIQQESCSQKLAGCKVTLNITPKPVKAMADLTFHVKLSGPVTDKALHIDLGMPGMKMGPNRVKLKSVGQNQYEGNGVIVRCPSGRTVWRATVVIPEKGQVDFIFNVIY